MDDGQQHAEIDLLEGGPRATELAYRVTQRRQAKGQGNRHEEQAPDKISVIHMKSDEVGGKVRGNKQPNWDPGRPAFRTGRTANQSGGSSLSSPAQRQEALGMARSLLRVSQPAEFMRLC
jgi:hypothetical protein